MKNYMFQYASNESEMDTSWRVDVLNSAKSNQKEIKIEKKIQVN